MDSELVFTNYVRKPFKVMAVQITKDNIAEVAKHVGALREQEDGTPYIQVDRRKVPNVVKVFLGSWMTKMGKNVRCYTNQVFNAQYIQATNGVEALLSDLGAMEGTPEQVFPQEGKMQNVFEQQAD